MTTRALNILVVEDEAIIAEDLKTCLEDLGYSVLGVAKSYEEGLQKFKTFKPDFVILDIVIDGEKDGIELAQAINGIKKVPFIFLSSHSDTATLNRAKEHLPSAYLVKPFEEEDIFTTIEVAIANYNATHGLMLDENKGIPRDSLFVKENHIYVKIPIKDMAFIKSDGNYLHIHGDGFHHMVRHTQKEILDILPSHFMKVHRSFIANASLISAIYPDAVEVINTKIPVSKDYREALLKRVTIM